MQAVEEGDVDQIGGPNHGGRPNQEATGQASEAVSSTQGSDAEKKLKRPTEILLIKETLGKQDIGRIEHTAAVGSLRRGGSVTLNRH